MKNKIASNNEKNVFRMQAPKEFYALNYMNVKKT